MLPPCLSPRLSSSPTGCLFFFSALSLTHTHTHAPRHTSGEADRCNTVARREGGSLALNNTGTRTDLLMERSGWGWNQEREMWEWYDVSAPCSFSYWREAFLPLFGAGCFLQQYTSPFISFCTAYYLQSDRWRYSKTFRGKSGQPGSEQTLKGLTVQLQQSQLRQDTNRFKV